MKITNIFLVSFILLLSGCSLYERFIDNNMYIANAGYKDWSEPPVRGDVPEKGTDLAVIVNNWPENTTPSFIIYNSRKSYKANISDRTDNGVVINARIVKASSVMTETSDKVDESDRLVYLNDKGETQHIDIEEWELIDK